MTIVIQELDETNIADAGRCEGEFVIDSQLILHANNGRIHYTVLDRPLARKRYESVPGNKRQ